MKLTTSNHCAQCGACAQDFPEYMAIGDDGTAYVKRQPPEDKFQEIIASCLVGNIITK